MSTRRCRQPSPTRRRRQPSCSSRHQQIPRTRPHAPPAPALVRLFLSVLPSVPDRKTTLSPTPPRTTPAPVPSRRHRIPPHLRRRPVAAAWPLPVRGRRCPCWSRHAAAADRPAPIADASVIDVTPVPATPCPRRHQADASAAKGETASTCSRRGRGIPLASFPSVPVWVKMKSQFSLSHLQFFQLAANEHTEKENK